jgi:hypothetical protein
MGEVGKVTLKVTIDESSLQYAGDRIALLARHFEAVRDAAQNALNAIYDLNLVIQAREDDQ